jgi:hypothetical protein
MWYVRYKVTAELDDGKIVEEGGIVAASSLADAVSQIETFYGDVLRDILLLRYLDEGVLANIPEEVLDKVEESVL